MLSWLDRFSTCKCEMWRGMVTRSQCSWPLCLDSILRVLHVQQDSHLWLWEYRWGGASPLVVQHDRSRHSERLALLSVLHHLHHQSVSLPVQSSASKRRSQRWYIFAEFSAIELELLPYTFPYYVSLYAIKIDGQWKMRHFGSVLEVLEASLGPWF